MKRILFLAAMAACVMSASADGPSFDRASRQVAVNNFSGVNVGRDIEVNFVPSATVSATVLGSKADVAQVSLDQKGEMLNITSTGRVGKVRVTLKSPAVTTVILNDRAKMRVRGTLDVSRRDFTVTATGNAELDVDRLICKDFNVNASGRADVDVDALTADDVLVKTADGAEVDLKGTANTVSLNAGGTSEIDAEELVAQVGAVAAVGASEVKCNVTGKFSQSTVGTAKVKNAAGR